MKTRNLIYLAQLEEYDLSRIKSWLKNNPGLSVPETKHHLKWTLKTIAIYKLTLIFGLFVGNQKALFISLKLLTPFDIFIKKIIIILATLKFKIFNKKTIVIGITGSWGKTTAKENLYAILKTLPHVFYTPANHNTLLAIAKQALFLPKKAKIFICEMGAYNPGDIQKICQIIHPQIGILTALGPMHLERFNTLENILKTKMELASNLPTTGIFWAPKILTNQLKKFPLPKNTKFFTDYSEIYFSLGFHFNLSQKNIQQTLDSIPPIEHRLQIIQNGSFTIIDDTYNSNPAGFHKALDKLKSIKSTEKILVTPGMIEMGNFQNSENQKAAIYAASVCTHIIIVGQTNKIALSQGAKLAKTKVKIITVPDLKSAQEILPTITTKNSAILFENDLSDQYF